MIITVTNILDIAPEHESLISVISLANGWDPQSGVTALEFMKDNVLQPRLTGFYMGLAGDSLRAWGGMSQHAQAQAVEALVREKLTTDIEVTSV